MLQQFYAMHCRKTLGLVTPWPPLASDLTMENSKNVVPVSLFNFLAWITASFDDAQFEKHINIVENGRHNKLTSIAQDTVHVVSDGRISIRWKDILIHKVICKK